MKKISLEEILNNLQPEIVIERIREHNENRFTGNKCWWRAMYIPNPDFPNYATMTFEYGDLRETIEEMEEWIKNKK